MSEEEKDAYEKSPIPRKACVRSRAAALLRDRPRRWSLILSLSGCLHVSETLFDPCRLSRGGSQLRSGRTAFMPRSLRQANAQQMSNVMEGIKSHGYFTFTSFLITVFFNP